MRALAITILGGTALLVTGCRTTAAVIEPAPGSPASASAEAAPLPRAGGRLAEEARTSGGEPEADEAGASHHGHGTHHSMKGTKNEPDPEAEAHVH